MEEYLYFCIKDRWVNKYYDCVIYSENQVLNYATTSRERYREFKSSGYICKECSSKHLCTKNAKFEKMVTKYIWSDYLETVEDIRHTPVYKACTNGERK